MFSCSSPRDDMTLIRPGYKNVQYFWTHVTSVYQGLCFPYQSLWTAQRPWVRGWFWKWVWDYIRWRHVYVRAYVRREYKGLECWMKYCYVYSYCERNLIWKMNCLHGKPAAYSTTSNGSFWFCNQNPTCNFFCVENEGYMYDKAITTWRCTEKINPRCGDHDKLSKMCVVKDLTKENYGRRILLRIFRIFLRIFRILLRIFRILLRILRIQGRN
jgi:hypothetical protein